MGMEPKEGTAATTACSKFNAHFMLLFWISVKDIGGYKLTKSSGESRNTQIYDKSVGGTR